VGEGRTDEREVEGVADPDVVYVPTAADQQLRVFDALDGVAEK
jgi:hypothetical protein